MQSEQASGTLASQLTFSKNKGRAYVKRYAKPRQPRTAPQKVNRLVLAYIVAFWRLLRDADPQPYAPDWQELATAAQTSQYNQFVKHNLLQWQQGNAPSYTPDKTVSVTTDGSENEEDEQHGNQVTINLTPSQDGNTYGWAIYRTKDAFPTTGNTNLHALIPSPDATRLTPVTFTDTLVEPGSYQYIICSLSPTGTLGMWTTAGPYSPE
jgi:hypothetical protein